MADAVGINLYDATMETTEMLKKLSAGMITTRGDIDNLFADSATRTFGFLETKIARDEASIGMDESARSTREAINAGEFGTTDALRFIQDQMGFGSDLFEGDRMAAANAMVEMFDRGGSVWTQEGGQLQGDKYKDAILTPEVRAILMQYQASVRQDNETAMRGLITGNLAGLGLRNTGAFSAYGDITGEQRGDLTRLFEGGGPLGALMDDEGVARYDASVIQGAIRNILGPASGISLGLAPTTAEEVAASDIEQAAIDFGVSVGEFQAAVDSLISTIGIGTGGGLR
ncbi:uncharacterized protein METZ01_LOCUS380401, partial [marine metagenome]